MNPLENDREPQRPGRRPGHDRDDSRQERERDYVKEVHQPPSPPQENHSRDRTMH